MTCQLIREYIINFHKTRSKAVTLQILYCNSLGNHNEHAPNEPNLANIVQTKGCNKHMIMVILDKRSVALACYEKRPHYSLSAKGPPDDYQFLIQTLL